MLFGAYRNNIANTSNSFMGPFFNVVALFVNSAKTVGIGVRRFRVFGGKFPAGT